MPGPAKPHLIVHSRAPFNAEPAPVRLRRHFITPVEDFYVRSHGDIPALDASTHRLRVEAGQPLHFSVEDLQARFEARSVLAVMQCAGNRRADMQPVERTSGDPWGPGAIGNAEWTGVRLADILRAAGLREDPALHVALEGADIACNEGAPDAPYGVSIPLAKALATDTLVAWAMNGAPLTPEHGAPLRAIVPGFAGARSVKWLRMIRVQAEPSQAFHQSRDYLLYPPDMRKATEDVSRGTVIDAMPVNAAICEPAPGASLPAGSIAVRGYAITSGRRITRVDLSPDGGRTWRQATLEEPASSCWSWTFWHATLDLDPGDHELCVRAWDDAGQTQPASVGEVWNFKGYLCTAWHCIRVAAS